MRQYLILFFCFTLPLSSVEAAKPSRRTVIEQGQQQLENAVQQKVQNTQQAGAIQYSLKTIPLLNYQFERPAREDEKDPSWSINNVSDTTSDFSTWKIYDGDYIAIIENRHEEDYSIFITSKDTTTIATIDDVKAYWEKMQRQPDHDNVYEYSHLPYIRELNIIRTDDYEYLGKPALFIEFAFSNWSKFWTETAVMFPHGKKIYTIKYRRERDKQDMFYHVFEHVLESFRFLTPEPSYSSFKDLSANHPHARAIERLKDLRIIGGYSDGSFKPEARINRAEFIKILTSEPLVNATELATCNTKQLQFSDVPADVWYAPHLCVAVERGMISGYPDGTFRGANEISFAEAAKIVSTFFARDAERATWPASSSLGGGWYGPFIRYLSDKRAIPVELTTPATPVTRSVMSEMIYRLFDKIDSEESLSTEDFDL
ncbi:MAG: S-layer homology domain-containing protein [Candidatus Peregrinibacteria bacterium]|nr:S-layer homology domain-containing protein [Candidatus Peregrinibacteria bacterium]